MELTLEQALEYRRTFTTAKFIIGVTGHRSEKLGGYSEFVRERLEGMARVVLEYFYPDFIVSGMALGWDTAVAKTSLSLNIPLVAAVPFKGQELRWPLPSQQTYRELLSKSLEVIYVYDGGYSPDKLQGRNEWIVDNVNLMLALWDGSKGGTYNCIQYCNKKNIPWVNLWDSWHENSGVFKNNNSIEEKVIIGNLKNLSPKLGYLDILADRSSPLGNPYELSREEDRELCTKAFDLWLKTNLKAYKYGELKNKKLDPKLILEENGWKFKIAQSFKYPTPSEIMAAIVKMMGMLDGGQKIRLLCHCDPKLCHTSIIKELLIDALNNLK